MANQVLSFSDLQNAIALFNALPATILFRGLTGYGLVLDGDGQEVIAEVSSAKAIWKPMYLIISGGKKRGREKLSAEMIQLCLEEFAKNPLWAVLKSTSGFGLRLNRSSEMAELADARQAESPINFEISHFGGRSILAMLSTQLGRIISQEIEWKGGFSYQNERNRPVKAGDALILNRLLSGDLNVERILADVVKEANRLSMMNTDCALPHIHNGTAAPMMQVFLRQELTVLVPGARLDRQAGFDYSVRQDGIEIQKRLAPYDIATAENFETAFTAFRKECARVQMLYCQPLAENQRQKAGRPSNEVFGVSDIQWLSWQAANRGDGVIAFHPDAPRKKDAVFPTEGWNPKEGERHRVLCLRKGNGFTGFPAPPAYIERYVQKDERTASLQLVLVNFDAREKVVSEKDVPLAEKWEWEDGRGFYNPRLEFMDDGWWIVEEICGFRRLKKEMVESSSYIDVNGKPITSILSTTVQTISCPAERRFRPEKIFLRPILAEGSHLFDLDPSTISSGWIIWSKGINPEGKNIEVPLYKEGGISEKRPFKWEEIPEDLQKQHLQAWPVCSCGRKRYEAAKFTQCDLCRDYRPCADCGKETSFGEGEIEEAERSSKSLYCRSCRSAWVNKMEPADEAMTPKFRQKIADEANFLLSGEKIEGELALNMLREKGLNCPPYTVVLIGSNYWATPFFNALATVATLPTQPPKKFLATMETLTANYSEFWEGVGDIVSKCFDNKPALGQVVGEFVEEAEAEEEEEIKPELEPAREPAAEDDASVAVKSGADFSALAKAWGARLVR